MHPSTSVEVLVIGVSSSFLQELEVKDK